jgi:hypothetical protein
MLRFDDTGTGAPHLVPLAGAGTTPTVAANPGVAPASSPTTVTGTGFPPNVSVTVQWVDPLTLAQGRFPEPAASVMTTGFGTFTTTMLTFKSTPLGGRLLMATTGAFTASTGYLVGALTGQAPDFITRG